MKKTDFVILLFCVLQYSCKAQTNIAAIAKPTKDTFNILGEWSVVKRISVQEKLPIPEEEKGRCLNHVITFSKESIVTPNDSCFYGDVCTSPNYKVRKYGTFQFFEDDTSNISLMGIAKDSVEVIENHCEHAMFSYIYILNQNTLFLGDGYGYGYFLNRVSSKLPNAKLPADTVRCRYKEGGGVCTGFILQGTRKGGKVVHVKPVNKNVPLEAEEKKKK